MRHPALLFMSISIAAARVRQVAPRLTRALVGAAGAMLMVAAVPAPGVCKTSTPLALAKALYDAEQAALADTGPPPWETPRRFFDARLNELF